MTSPTEQSFKKRLQIIAKEMRRTPAEIWQNVIIERFLVRLYRSPYHENFILKGGTLLARYVDLGRETKDLDFVIQGFSNQISILQKTFDEIVNIDLADGFIFRKPCVEALEHFHMLYPGAQIKIEVHFGKAKFPLYIDLGFGDRVHVRKEEFALLSNAQGPLFEASLTMNCYPIEFIFAEKLETAISRGANNSRMKDFHDLYTLSNTEKMIKGTNAVKAIRLVFEHRKTPLQLPLHFNSAAIEALQKYWERYLPTTPTSAYLPTKIADVIAVINQAIDKMNQN